MQEGVAGLSMSECACLTMDCFLSMTWNNPLSPPLGVVNPGYAASSLRFDPLICRVSRNRQIVCL